MGLALSQIPDQPGVNGAKEQISLLSLCPCPFHIVQNPFDLGGGKIGVHHQTGIFPDILFHFFICFDGIADIGGAPALPDNGVVYRTAADLVPDNGSFPLVGDADGGKIPGRDVRPFNCLLGHAALGCPDFNGVMLHPAGLRVYLFKFLLGHCNDAAPMVKEYGPGTGCPLIQR